MRAFVPASGVRYWLDPDAPSTAHVPPGNFELARTELDLAGGVTRVLDGGTIAPGLSYGHPPGQSTMVVEDVGESLLRWADITHSNLLQFGHPEWASASTMTLTAKILSIASKPQS